MGILYFEKSRSQEYILCVKYKKATKIDENILILSRFRQQNQLFQYSFSIFENWNVKILQLIKNKMSQRIYLRQSQTLKGNSDYYQKDINIQKKGPDFQENNSQSMASSLPILEDLPLMKNFSFSPKVAKSVMVPADRDLRKIFLLKQDLKKVLKLLQSFHKFEKKQSKQIKSKIQQFHDYLKDMKDYFLKIFNKLQQTCDKKQIKLEKLTQQNKILRQENQKFRKIKEIKICKNERKSFEENKISNFSEKQLDKDGEKTKLYGKNQKISKSLDQEQHIMIKLKKGDVIEKRRAKYGSLELQIQQNPLSVYQVNLKITPYNSQSQGQNDSQKSPYLRASKGFQNGNKRTQIHQKPKNKETLNGFQVESKIQQQILYPQTNKKLQKKILLQKKIHPYQFTSRDPEKLKNNVQQFNRLKDRIQYLREEMSKKTKVNQRN